MNPRLERVHETSNLPHTERGKTWNPPEIRCQSSNSLPRRNPVQPPVIRPVSPETWCGRYKWTDSRLQTTSERRETQTVGVWCRRRLHRRRPDSTGSESERPVRQFTGNPVSLSLVTTGSSSPDSFANTRLDVRGFHRKPGVCQRCNVLGSRYFAPVGHASVSNDTAETNRRRLSVDSPLCLCAGSPETWCLCPSAVSLTFHRKRGVVNCTEPTRRTDV